MPNIKGVASVSPQRTDSSKPVNNKLLNSKTMKSIDHIKNNKQEMKTFKFTPTNPEKLTSAMEIIYDSNNGMCKHSAAAAIKDKPNVQQITKAKEKSTWYETVVVVTVGALMLNSGLAEAAPPGSASFRHKMPWGWGLDLGVGRGHSGRIEAYDSMAILLAKNGDNREMQNFYAKNFKK